MQSMDYEFTEKVLDRDLRWYCEPTRWEIDPVAGRLVVFTDTDTDYWQRTHYGFRRDNGHLLYVETEGDFRLETRVNYEPAADFDQAGLMVRYSSQDWIKTSVEMEKDGSFHLGAVVTCAGYSDWSTQNFPRGLIDIGFRIARVGDDFQISWRPRDGEWQQLRLAHLPPPSPPSPLLAGLYAASPATGGCEVHFDHLIISI